MRQHYSPASVSQITAIARGFLRDYPKFLQVDFEAKGRTYELGSPNIDPDSLWVATYTTSTPVEVTADVSASAHYSLDARNGIIRFSVTPPTSSRILIEGYYYEWVLPADLEFYARQAIEQHTYNLELPLENMAEIMLNTIGMSCVVETLWGLMTEYSRDIDVTTSESVHIPASQRFRMVQSLLEYWTKQYELQARALNVGLQRIEMMELTRTSRTTGLLVPKFKPRELGYYGPLERVFTEIGSREIAIEDVHDDLREDVFLDISPNQGYSSTAIHGL